MPSWIQPFCTKLWLKLIQSHSNSFILTQLDNASYLEFCHLGFIHFAQKTSLIHSDSTWWWQPSWTLPCWIQALPSWIQTPCYLLSDSLKNTHTATLTLTQTNSIWLRLIHSHLTWWWQPSWKFCHLGFSHLSISSQTHSHLPRFVPTICTKKTSLIHSDSSWWWQPSWILPSWIQTLPSWIQTPC